MPCNVSCVPLFPSSVFTLNVDDDFSKLLKLKEYNYKKQKIGHLCYSTLSKDVLNQFPKEKEKLQIYFDSVKDNILSFKNTKFNITTSWGTKCESGGYSQYHHHRNCMYSAIFYYDDCDDVGDLEFENFYRRDSFEIVPDSYNLHNSVEWKFTPVKNLLIIFPSYLHHRIGYNPSQVNNRYSLALNFHPCGEYGRGDSSISL